MPQFRILAVAAAVVGALVALVTPTVAPAAATSAGAEPARFVAVAKSYLQARADALIVGSNDLDLRRSLVAVPMVSSLHKSTSRAVAVLAARRQADHAGGVDYIRSAVDLQDPSVSTASNGTTTLNATDVTKLYFKPIPGAPPYEEWSVARTFTFSPGATVPVLVDARLADSTGPLTTVDVSPGEAAAASTPPPLPSSTATVPPGAAATVRPPKSSGLAPTAAIEARGSIVPAAGYNYSAMISFATHNWNTTLTPRWNNDCTNFLSRALLAGGWRMVSKSPYGSDRSRYDVWYDSYMPGRGGHWWYSYSWSTSNYWNAFARGSGRVTALGNVWYTLASDVLQAKWAGTSTIDHSMVVTAVDVHNGHYLTYHTNNTLNRPLIDILRANPGTTWYADRT